MECRKVPVGGAEVKNLPADAGEGSIPGSGKSPGVGNGNPLQYSCLENSMNRGASWATYSPGGSKESDTTEHACARHAQRRKFSLFPLPSPFRLECRHNSILNGHEAEQTLGDSEGQGSLAGCSPWGRKESDTTERQQQTQCPELQRLTRSL